MIIKGKDPVDANLKELNNLKKLPNLSKEKLAKIEKELRLLKSGNKGEQDSAYFIDFYYKDSQNWIVIHDLRIECNNRVAQIDHLLINRFLDFYVLETKHYAHGIKVTERGEFLVWFQKNYISIESPIEQNQRHIKVLKNLLQRENVLPNRLGFSLQPNFLPYVLVSPKSRIIRPKTKEFNTDIVIKADEFYKQIQDNINNKSTVSSIESLAKIVSQESIKEIGEKLINLHKPIKINYYGKLEIYRAENIKVSNTIKLLNCERSKYYCCDCNKSISQKVASFCFNNKNRFKGKAYCYNCQSLF